MSDTYPEVVILFLTGTAHGRILVQSYGKVPISLADSMRVTVHQQSGPAPVLTDDQSSSRKRGKAAADKGLLIERYVEIDRLTVANWCGGEVRERVLRLFVPVMASKSADLREAIPNRYSDIANRYLTKRLEDVGRSEMVD